MDKKFIFRVIGVFLFIFSSVFLAVMIFDSDQESLNADLEGNIEIVETVDTEIVLMDDSNEEDTCVFVDDFRTESPQLRWYVVNDGVMGGLSEGRVFFEDNSLVHAGVLNTNGGGFSYVGARLPEDTLAGYSNLQVRLNTSGREYALNLEDARNSRISHQALIPLGSSDAWQEVSIGFDETVPTIFSREVNSEPFLDTEVNELSFILGDGIDGEFRMEIEWIKACL